MFIYYIYSIHIHLDVTIHIYLDVCQCVLCAHCVSQVPWYAFVKGSLELLPLVHWEPPYTRTPASLRNMHRQNHTNSIKSDSYSNPRCYYSPAMPSHLNNHLAGYIYIYR